MFLCGLCAVLVALLIASRVREPERWDPKSSSGANASMTRSFSEIFSSLYRRKTVVNADLLTVAIIGLWAGTVYEPTAVLTLARKMGRSVGEASKSASLATGVLLIGTIIGGVIAPQLAERFGRKKTLAFYFVGMGACIFLSFGGCCIDRMPSYRSSLACFFSAFLAAISQFSVCGCPYNMKRRSALPHLRLPRRSEDSLARA